MMQKLLAGERRATPLQVTLAVAVFFISLALLFFLWDARNIATKSQKTANDAVKTERSILTAIVLGCDGRLKYDTKQITLAKQVHDFAAALDEVLSETTIPPNADPKMVAQFKAEVLAIQNLSKASKVLADGKPVNNCAKYAKILAQLEVDNAE